MKHTKGPWNIEGLVESNGVGAKRIVAPCNTYAIADVYEAAEKNGAYDANARLIAAAPELLEALKLAYDYIADSWDKYTFDGKPIDKQLTGDEQEMILKLDKAIAKAEGEES